jgi:TPR repeat protein
LFAEACVIFFTFDMHNFTKAVVLLVASFLISCELSAFAFEKRPYSAALLEKAKQGDAKSQVGLGLCYERGEGVPEDKVEAVKWYCKAAEQGYAEGQFNLGYCYDAGVGVPEDNVEAVKWYRKAAEQGHVMAQTKLGICYAHGEGVPQDKVEAYALYNLASVKNELARNFRDSIAKEMTPDQITAAEKRTLEHQKEFKHN